MLFVNLHHSRQQLQHLDCKLCFLHSWTSTRTIQTPLYWRETVQLKKKKLPQLTAFCQFNIIQGNNCNTWIENCFLHSWMLTRTWQDCNLLWLGTPKIPTILHKLFQVKTSECPNLNRIQTPLYLRESDWVYLKKKRP